MIFVWIVSVWVTVLVSLSVSVHQMPCVVHHSIAGTLWPAPDVQVHALFYNTRTQNFGSVLELSQIFYDVCNFMHLHEFIWLAWCMWNANQYELFMLRHLLSHGVPAYHIMKSTKIKICPICLCNEKGRIVQLSCHHKFHERCIMQWFKTSKSCPICRAPSS